MACRIQVSKPMEAPVAKVSDVLAAKARSGVFTMPPSATVADATRLMALQNVGCIVVSDTGSDVKGLLCERQIIRKIADLGLICLLETLGDVMKRSPATCRPSCDVEKVRSTMVAGQLRYMPVVERGRLIGMLSLADMVAVQMDPQDMTPFQLAYA